MNTKNPQFSIQITLLVAKKVTVPARFLDFVDIFSKKLTAEFSKHFDINKYLINLEPNTQPPYSLIYSLQLIEFETLKVYIKTNLANTFIWLLKFFLELLSYLFKNLISKSLMTISAYI